MKQSVDLPHLQSEVFALPFYFCLLNHLIRPRQHIRRNRQADLLGGLEIDEELKLRRLLDGNVGGLGAF